MLALLVQWLAERNEHIAGPTAVDGRLAEGHLLGAEQSFFGVHAPVRLALATDGELRALRVVVGATDGFQAVKPELVAA